MAFRGYENRERRRKRFYMKKAAEDNEKKSGRWEWRKKGNLRKEGRKEEK